MPRFISLSDAAGTLACANRVMVIGCSGGGKTTLALSIAETFGMQYISLDRDVRWLPDWKVRDSTKRREITIRLAQQERWVMDGTSPASFDLRVPRAQLIIWVRVPRHIALLGLARRVALNFGKVRVAMAEGCPEPLPDRAFLSYIWHFEKRSAPVIIREIDRVGPEVPVVITRSYADAQCLLTQSTSR